MPQSRSRVFGAGLLRLAITAVAFKLMGDWSGRFAEGHGVSILFPPAALYVAAGAAAGLWGAAGVALGSLFVGWGAAATLSGRLLFALVHALATTVPALALRTPSGSSAGRVLRAVAAGVVGNNLLAALVGTALLRALGTLPPGIDPFADSAVAWWMTDVVAAFALGLPLVVALRPEALLDAGDRELYASWLHNPGQLLRAGALLASAAAAMFAVHHYGWGFPEWLAIALVAPIALAAFDAGVGASVLVNLLVSIFYFSFVVVAAPPRLGTVREMVAPAYLVLLFFTCFAVVGGLLAGANRALLERVRAQQRLLQRDFERVVASLSAAIEAKDPTTEGHVQRVSAMTVAVGRRLGVEGHALELLRYGALLHDVGKIGVPESILNKPGPLTPEESEAMERHVEIGLRIIGSVEVLQGVAPLIRFHQERWDGLQSGVKYRGYFGLRGEEIPLGARILAVVDAFDAITHDRPYRAAQPVAAAIAELRREAGRQFDPAVVEATIAVVEHQQREDSSGELPRPLLVDPAA